MTNPTYDDGNRTKSPDDITKKQRTLIAAILDYTMCLEEKLNDLHHFQQWAVPRLTDCEIQIGGLKAEM